MIGLGLLRCFFLGSLMTWYTASVWQTVDRYFRDQFRVYLDKEYEENAELKKDVMMEVQREAAKKALIENIAKMELNKALDRQAELAKKKQPQLGRRGESMYTEDLKGRLRENEGEDVDVCNEEDDRGGTCGKDGTYGAEFVEVEEGMDLVKEGHDVTSNTEVVMLETEGAWVTTGETGSIESEAADGIDGIVKTEIYEGEELTTGADDSDESTSYWETERIIAEMQKELETDLNVWKTGECENEANVQEECSLEEFAEVELSEGVGKKWRNVFDEDEMCLVDSSENRGSCSHNVEIEGEGIVIKRPFGN